MNDASDLGSASRSGSTFDPGLWRPSYLLYAHIPDFIRDLGPTCQQVDPGPPSRGYPTSEIAEVARKRRLLDTDPDRRRRIMSQDRGFPEFLEPFGLTYEQAKTRLPWVHTATWMIPVEVARPVLLTLKAHHNAARPWEVDPHLHPVVDNPGHPAYPSGHTCQTLLAVLMIKLVLPSRLLTGAAVKTIEDLAADTAVNREYAGLHYESDTLAGARLAHSLMPYIQNHFRDIIVGAQAEALKI